MNKPVGFFFGLMAVTTLLVSQAQKQNVEGGRLSTVDGPSHLAALPTNRFLQRMRFTTCLTRLVIFEPQRTVFFGNFGDPGTAVRYFDYC